MDKVTQILQRQIAMYEARIRKIAESPDSMRLKSNKAMYELMRDYNTEMLRHWQAKKPFILGNAYPPVRLLSSLSFFVISLDASAQQRIKNAPEYIDLAKSRGFSDDCCNSTRAGVGVVLAGDVPPPSILYSDNYCCLPFVYRTAFLSREYHVPVMDIDAGCYVDDQGDDFQALVDYVAEQYKRKIPLLESISGVRYDEDRLRELQAHHHEAIRLAVEIYEMSQSVPAPISGMDCLRFYPRAVSDASRLARYLEALRDELKERVKAGIGAVRGDKLRLLWLQTPPLFTDSFRFLEERGVAVLTEMGGLNVQRAIRPADELVATDSPLQREARWAFNFHGYGRAERRVQGTLRLCREYRVDGVVNCNQRLCHYYEHTARIIQERVENELGIPVLTLTGDFMDMRDFDEAGYYRQLEQFVEVCSARKGTRLVR